MPAEDIFSRFRQDNFSPVTNAVAVTPHNTEDLAYVTRALYVGGGGDVKVDLQDSGTAIIFSLVPTGTTLPIRVTRVYATGTDASGIVALW
jgi:hypothetical protein